MSTRSTRAVVGGRWFALESDQRTSERMAAVARRDTPAELAARRALTALGLRYRLHDRGLPGSPDIANRACRWAVFVHGCFWHSHQDCRRARLPSRNRAFWKAKLERNRERDRVACRTLRDLGFDVLILWECETRREATLRHRVSQLCCRSTVVPSPILRGARTRTRNHGVDSNSAGPR